MTPEEQPSLTSPSLTHPNRPWLHALWKPGQSGNPSGRKTLGAYISEHVNSMAQAFENETLTRVDLKKIAREDPNPNRVAAAMQLLDLIERPDMADFEPVLDGKKNLEQLRAQGVDTTALKKIKQKERFIPNGEDPPIQEVEREIELHDRHGAAFERVLDRIDGKPSQSLEVKGVIAHVRTIYVDGGIDPDLLTTAAVASLQGGSGGAIEVAGEGNPDGRAGGDGQEPGLPG